MCLCVQVGCAEAEGYPAAAADGGGRAHRLYRLPPAGRRHRHRLTAHPPLHRRVRPYFFLLSLLYSFGYGNGGSRP